MEAVKETIIELHLGGEWVPAAKLRALGNEACRIEYLTSYLFSENPQPISQSLPIGWEPDTLVEGVGVDPQYERRPPAFIYDLVPQGKGRKFLVGELGLKDSENLVMPLVMAGAFNPIGNLRLRSALDFYQQQLAKNPEDKALAGFDFADIKARSNDFIEHLSLHSMLAAGTTGVQGVAPKFLLARDAEDRWFADLALSDTAAQSHWLLKLPRGRSEDDLAVLRNEAAYLRLAAMCGLRTNEPPQLVDNILILRRFDRTVQTKNGKSLVIRHAQESLASVAGLRGFAPKTTQNELLYVLRTAVNDPAAETLEFIKRDVLNQAMRNTDNHARNTSIRRFEDGTTQLSPVYDFAPMFMDPEVVPRAVHWRDADGNRLTDWTQVLSTLDISAQERTWLIEELGKFSETVSSIPVLAKDAGVEEHVLEMCKGAINEQAKQLGELHFADAPTEAQAMKVPRG